MNCTFARNSAENGIGGASAEDGFGGVISPLTFINSIMWNEGLELVELPDPSPEPSIFVSFSDIKGGFEGLGHDNINRDPLLIDPEAGDLRVPRGSPVLDAGTSELNPYDLSFIQQDIVGIKRPQDGDRDGIPQIDMGAYEFKPSARPPVRNPLRPPTREPFVP